MIDIRNKEYCCGCSACSNACPKRAITMEYDNEGFLYPLVNKKNCIDCGLCDNVCPVNIKRPNGDIKAYGAYNLNEKERLQSSSGGIFILLAKCILKENGSVYGAAFDEKFNLSHISVKKTEDLTWLMGSKYLQSNITESYKQLENELKEGIKVLFSGTPCQIAGLKSYLRKDYENLYLTDVACHGAPSPIAFKKYKEYLENKHHSEMISYSFRSKPSGWRHYENNIKFESGKEISQDVYENIYMRAFLKNTTLRPSCFNCAFKTLPKDSDITLADFWGINKATNFKDDDKGISLVLVNTKKGEELLELINKEAKIFEVDKDEAIKYNPAIIKSALPHPERAEFLNNLTSENFKKKVHKHLNLGITRELKIKIKYYLKNIKKRVKK